MEYQVIREMNQPLVGHQGAGENTRTQSGYRKSRDTQQERHEGTEKIERIHKYLQEITTSTEIKMKVTGATSQKSAQCLTLIHSVTGFDVVTLEQRHTAREERQLRPAILELDRQTQTPMRVTTLVEGHQ